MKFSLKRIAFKDHYTIGKFYIDGVYFCDTIEDKDRFTTNPPDCSQKVLGETCIPKGIYRVSLSWSDRFNELMPRILDVPCFDGILIHNGVDENSTEGCVILGENKEVGKVTNSTFYFHKLKEILAERESEEAFITIE